MLSARVVLITLALMHVGGCYHPIEIVGQGNVISASGNRNCLLEDFQADPANCTGSNIQGDYVETYTGVAAPDWQFRRWNNGCSTALNNECVFDMPASFIDQMSGLTAGPLQAIFRSTQNTGFTSVFMGHSFMAPLAAGLEEHANSVGFTDHSTTTFSADGAQGAPLAFWDDVSLRANIQAVLDSGAIELFGMSYDPAYPEVVGYKKWVDYALQKNPDTRFFIAIPWPLDPTIVNSTQYEASYHSTELAVYLLIDQLRVRWPGVDFYAVPYGRSAVELHTLYNAGNLPDASALVGASATSVFQDTLGNPGAILELLGELVSLGAIYDVDLGSYNFEPAYSADLMAIAQTILDEQNTTYRAPPEVDTDTDGDGIVDRLDPNPNGKLNILVMMADDLGYNDLAINNDNTEVDTPSMDQLARDGVRFTRHYAAPVCSPARAAFLTGLYPERVGFLPNALGISPDIITLPERLQQAGYTTWHIGKWHIGDLERTAWPDHQGFDHWLAFLNQWRLAGRHVGGELELSTPRYEDPWLQGDTEPGRHFPGHLENILTDKSIEVLTELNNAGAPWFLNLWFYAVHGPIQPAVEFADKYPDTAAGKYQALLNQLDTNVGRVMAHLESIGALGNTIVVVVSDNGGTNIALDNNAPYTGKKPSASEGGLRTPLIIHWPDATLNGQVIADTVSIEDIYPTLMEAVGVTAPDNLDGQSFYSSLQQSVPVPAREQIREVATDAYGVLSYGMLSEDGRWRLHQPLSYYDVYVEPRIYDLELDPTATQYLVPTPPEQLAPMEASYRDWYRDVHTVKTQYMPDANGGGVLTGTDFLRTPGFAQYTFGISIADTLDGQIAAQQGIWNITRSGNTVTAQYGDLILAGDIAQESSCHSIVVTGNFKRQVGNNVYPDNFHLALTIDGNTVDQDEIEATLAVADPTVVTIVGSPQNPGQSGAMTPPVILNSELTAITPWTLAEFSQELCN